MCGIAGIINLSTVKSQSAIAIQKMATAMIHRGPDDEGFLLGCKESAPIQIFKGTDTPLTQDQLIPFYPSDSIESAYSQEAHLFLAHRRLAIVDLSANGHQPMCTKDKRFWIIFNGEIYNFPEIAQELKSLGITFLGHSDTEVLLYAYREWGTDVLAKLNGMFAFAIWDDHEKELFCARDRIGIKPFYYTIQNNQFIFASDIKTIIASGLYKPDIDLEGLYHVMSFGVAPRPMTAFKDVKALEQAHWLKIYASGKIESNDIGKFQLAHKIYQ